MCHPDAPDHVHEGLGTPAHQRGVLKESELGELECLSPKGKVGQCDKQCLSSMSRQSWDCRHRAMEMLGETCIETDKKEKGRDGQEWGTESLGATVGKMSFNLDQE